jgi:hypothetical protein
MAFPTLETHNREDVAAPTADRVVLIPIGIAFRGGLLQK